MRFNEIYYSHTENFEDVKEIKFIPNSMEYATVEIWLQDDHTSVVLVDNITNDVEDTTEEEEVFVLEFARKNNLI
jgi:hypothetical protein